MLNLLNNITVFHMWAGFMIAAIGFCLFVTACYFSRSFLKMETIFGKACENTINVLFIAVIALYVVFIIGGIVSSIF